MYLCISKFVAMTVLTIKINQRTKAGKAFMAMSESFFKGLNGIEVIEEHPKKEKILAKSIYSDTFIAKMKKAKEEIKKGNTTRLDPNDVWGSIL